MQPLFKPSPVEFNQRLLFPSNVFDLLGKDHECYLYQDIFQQLDTSELESHYSGLGQHAYHPELIVSILVYAYSRGVFSSREIERRCHEDLSFMYIARMNCPNFRVLSDFRKDHSGFFHDCFKQTVKLAMELKLASLGHISLDGSKFKANSSKHKAMSYPKMEKDDSKAVYKERKVIVEPVFGQIKNTGFRRFSVRGKEKVAGEFSLVCAVHNIKKIARAMVEGVVRQEHGRLVGNPGI